MERPQWHCDEALSTAVPIIKAIFVECTVLVVTRVEIEYVKNCFAVMSFLTIISAKYDMGIQKKY